MTYRSLIILLIYVACSGCLASRENRPQSDAISKVYFVRYLSRLGDRFDCYFTLETSRNKDRLERLDYIYVRDDTPLGDIGSLQGKLQKEVGAYVVVRNHKMRNVYHIIDESLLTSDGYALERGASLTYNGSLAGLASAIGDSIAGIGPKRFGIGQREAFDDYETQVSIRVVNETVRDILTEGIPLRKYKRVLWYSEFQTNTAALPRIAVQFYGKNH